jgi:hypothetical protein
MPSGNPGWIGFLTIIQERLQKVLVKKSIGISNQASTNLCTYRHYPGVNPTTASYNVNAANISTSSLVRFEDKSILFYYEKRSCLLQRWGCKFSSCKICSCALH